MVNNFKKSDKISNNSFVWIVLLLLLLFCLLIVFSYVNRQNSSLTSQSIDLESTELSGQKISFERAINEWNNIPIPKSSHFGFHYPPQNKRLWEKAKLIASTGTPILLSNILTQFDRTGFLDFLDGSTFLKNIYRQVDAFISKENADDVFNILSSRTFPSKEQQEFSVQVRSRQGTILNAENYVPDFYDYTISDRAPILSIGYHLFDKYDDDLKMNGNMIGKVEYTTDDFLSTWSKFSTSIKTPFISLQVENYGVLASNFPNRTSSKLPQCCRLHSQFMEFLNHKNTLLFVINQHYNFSHPKVLALPRGIKLSGQHTPKVLRDTMIYSSQNVQKNTLLLSFSSKWHSRPKIISCIQKKLSAQDFEILHKSKSGIFVNSNTNTNNDNNSDELKSPKFSDVSFYFQKLASAKFVLGVPGLGYDCYRNWEALTMGSVLVTERGVGLDRTFWRLPVLLVEDFAEITTQLLRSAYVEAVYRTLTKQFEFERLTQSFWWSVLNNVSLTRSNNIILEKFPMRAEDADFTQPWIPYDCGRKRPMTCGKGTKRIPVETC